MKIKWREAAATAPPTVFGARPLAKTIVLKRGILSADTKIGVCFRLLVGIAADTSADIYHTIVMAVDTAHVASIEAALIPPRDTQVRAREETAEQADSR